MVIAAGKFKAVCLQLMDEVGRTGEEVVITKHGRPVAKLVPVDAEVAPKTFGLLSEQTVICGDIIGPTGERREADG